MVLAAAVLCLGFFPSEARGDTGKAAIEDIVVTNTRDSLLVYFTVTNCFTDEMVRAIENGIPTSFLFFIKLYRKRSLWWDKEIASLTITHEIKYDNLRRVYAVKRSDDEEAAVQVTDFEQAKKLMSEIVAVKLADLSILERGNRYRVSMMVEMDKIQLPFPLHYIFFFVRLWDFKTPWYNMEFLY